jgi:predicted nucleotidyltransferase
MNITKLKKAKEILSMVLFGSAARRDNDSSSDKDYFFLCQDMSLQSFLKIKRIKIASLVEDDVNISAYRLADVKIMAAEGSLFLWHLKLQGRIVFSKNSVIENIFDSLKEYNAYKKDLEYYDELLNDVKASLAQWKILDEFDLSLLFTIVRNTCILLSHYLGAPKYGRSNAFIYVKSVYNDLPLGEHVYQELCSWKLWYERGIKPMKSQYSQKQLYSVIKDTESFIRFAQKQCK